MPPDEPTHRASRPVPPSVAVEIRSQRVAVVTVSGEHDLHSKPALTRALARAIEHPNVFVDLTDCTFIDSSAIGALISASRALAERNGSLELVIPSAAATVSRVVRMTAISTAVPIHETRLAADASRQQREEFAGRSALAAVVASQ
jgi:stage II sporulation protein AA (anti-sigma F factor antagonist)